jgi:ATPase family associated with various cellular activities (AAA)/Winged helix domain, variant
MSEDAWEAANQRRLAAEVARVRAAVERRFEPDGADAPEPSPADEPDGQSAAIDLVATAFGLSPFERDVLLLAAGVELDGSFASLCACGQPELGVAAPTFSLALAAFDDAHWSALSPDRPLRRWRLLDMADSGSLVTAPLRIDERVLHFLAGVQTSDERLRGITRAIEAAPLASVHAEVAGRIASVLPSGRGVELSGGDRDARIRIAATAAGELDLVGLELRSSDIPPTASERLSLARLLEREAVLGRSLAVLNVVELEPDQRRPTIELVESLASPFVVLAQEPLRGYAEPLLRIDLPPLSAPDRKRLLIETLDGVNGNGRADVSGAAQQFRLDSVSLQAAATQLAAGYRSGESLWDALREQARPSLDGLAQRIEPAATWEDLVLPAPIVDTLRQIVLRVHQRARVYEDWGFARRSARGLGVSALFAGPSGTGKTTAAEILARELRLDLYRIDLSAVVSKYIGETEKNLRRLFDAADEGGAILLFDEADALFGKRSEVKDSHDRYANIEISYLLQRMEAYRGLAILTTNQRQALDPAFMRRLRFVLQFPFPDAAQRAEIWRRIFPSETPVDGIDAELLAQLNVTGGTIRNIALSAAFIAADVDEPVRMGHLLRAARTEHAKIEKPLTDAEVAGWS